MTDSVKVLIVDDEMDYLETLVKRMRKRHVDITGIANGEEALEWLAQNGVDIVILDVKMPGMDGIQALREIKTRYPLVEVIMLTGHANIEVAIEGMELGAFDYLMKPMDIDGLLYKIQDAYKKKVIQQEKIHFMEKPGGTE
jgi:DNA-binding NtrC family response regulator